MARATMDYKKWCRLVVYELDVCQSDLDQFLEKT